MKLRALLEGVSPIQIYNTPEFVQAVENAIEKDGSSFICSYVASAIKMLGGDRIKIFGFSQKENPQAIYFQDEDEDEGHHFAVLDDRYIVDPWIYNNGRDNDKTFSKAVFDLKSPQDKKDILYIYGNPKNWTDITKRIDSFEKLFPKTADSLNQYKL